MTENFEFGGNRIVALAGGVGGAKMVDGLAQVVKPGKLTIIVNTGDDFEHLGLRICPDLDTVCYTLAGVANPATGWGRSDETWKALETIASLGGPAWFRLGDHDLGIHLERTRRLKNGDYLSEITKDFCRALGIEHTILPMTEFDTPTRVETRNGVLEFQDYFVRQRCSPEVTGFIYSGCDSAKPAPGIIESIRSADLVIFCPSNPWVSISPILALTEIKNEILNKSVSIAVSPIIGGKALKGPAAKMYSEMGITPTVIAVAEHYKSLISGFVFDEIDLSWNDSIENMGLKTLVTDTVMKTRSDRRRLAIEIIKFGLNIR